MAGQAVPQLIWERISEKDGVVAYRREVPGSPLIAFRGEGVINAPILRVASVLVDNTRSTEWIDSLAEARTLRRISENEFIEYNHVKTPIMMKDRDFVLDAKLDLVPAEKKVILNVHSVTDPLAPRTDYVRGELLKSSFTLTSIDHGTKTLLVAEIHADPKGSVAKWIVNMFQKNWPHNTIRRLRQVATRHQRASSSSRDARRKGLFQLEAGGTTGSGLRIGAGSRRTPRCLQRRGPAPEPSLFDAGSRARPLVATVIAAMCTMVSTGLFCWSTVTGFSHAEQDRGRPLRRRRMPRAACRRCCRRRGSGK